MNKSVYIIVLIGLVFSLGIVDAQECDDFDCMLAGVESCVSDMFFSATLSDFDDANNRGVESETRYMEFSGKDGDKCMFLYRTDYIQYEGASIENPPVEITGLEHSCSFDQVDLTTLLTDWKAGTIDPPNCEISDEGDSWVCNYEGSDVEVGSCEEGGTPEDYGEPDDGMGGEYPVIRGDGFIVDERIISADLGSCEDIDYETYLTFSDRLGIVKHYCVDREEFREGGTYVVKSFLTRASVCSSGEDSGEFNEINRNSKIRLCVDRTFNAENGVDYYRQVSIAAPVECESSDGGVEPLENSGTFRFNIEVGKLVQHCKYEEVGEDDGEGEDFTCSGVTAGVIEGFESCQYTIASGNAETATLIGEGSDSSGGDECPATLSCSCVEDGDIGGMWDCVDATIPEDEEECRLFNPRWLDEDGATIPDRTVVTGWESGRADGDVIFFYVERSRGCIGKDIVFDVFSSNSLWSDEQISKFTFTARDRGRGYYAFLWPSGPPWQPEIDAYGWEELLLQEYYFVASLQEDPTVSSFESDLIEIGRPLEMDECGESNLYACEETDECEGLGEYELVDGTCQEIVTPEEENDLTKRLVQPKVREERDLDSGIEGARVVMRKGSSTGEEVFDETTVAEGISIPQELDSGWYYIIVEKEGYYGGPWARLIEPLEDGEDPETIEVVNLDLVQGCSATSLNICTEPECDALGERYEWGSGEEDGVEECLYLGSEQEYTVSWKDPSSDCSGNRFMIGANSVWVKTCATLMRSDGSEIERSGSVNKQDFGRSNPCNTNEALTSYGANLICTFGSRECYDMKDVDGNDVSWSGSMRNVGVGNRCNEDEIAVAMDQCLPAVRCAKLDQIEVS